MYKENDIVTFKLISGEEIVSKYVSETDTSFRIYKPLSLMPGPQGMALAQALMSSKMDKELDLMKTAVVMHTFSREEMTSAWYEATSGIRTPNNKILMG
jgi:hypothetical protein